MEITRHSVAAISGGASGLGFAVASALAARGAKVAILDRDEKTGTRRAAEIGALFCTTDVALCDQVASSLATVKREFGGLHIMVNCAGIGPAAKTVSKGAAHDPALFYKTLQVNLIGSFNCSSQAAVIMAENTPLNRDGERGVIVMSASVAAFEGQVGQVAYAASKGGIVAMTLPMARDLAGHGIRVNTIAPGIFNTPLLGGLTPEVQDSLAAQVPFPKRLGDPQEYAALALHVIENGMLNGEVIRLDGAIRMGPR